MVDTPTLDDSDAIDAIIELMEKSIALIAQYQPMALALPQVQDLVNQVGALRINRGL